MGLHVQMPTRSPGDLRVRTGLLRYALLTAYLIGLFGWVTVVPLYGSVGQSWAAAHAVPFAPLPLWWLGGYAPALVLCGVIWDRLPRAAAVGAQAAAAVNIFLTLLLFWMPAPGWPLLFALMGAATAMGMTVWGRWYATTVEASRLGRVFGAAAAGVSLVNWIFHIISRTVPSPHALLLTLAPLLLAVSVPGRVDPAVDPSRARGRAPGEPLGAQLRTAARLGLFIIFFSVVARLSYRVLIAAPVTPFADESLRRLPYIVGVVAAGVLADRRNLVCVLVGGAGLLALSFLIGAWGNAPAQYVGIAMNGAAFGLLEPAPWLLLAANATPASAGRWFGWGLSLNVLPIAFGALLAIPFGQLSPERLGLLATMVILLAVLSLHGVSDPLASLRREDESGQATAEAEAAPPEAETPQPPLSREAILALLVRRYGTALSGRELEIAQLAVVGMPTREIAQQLFISENTVKTHLRNIFRKTETANRNDLYRRLVEAGRAAQG